MLIGWGMSILKHKTTPPRMQTYFEIVKPAFAFYIYEYICMCVYIIYIYFI